MQLIVSVMGYLDGNEELSFDSTLFFDTVCECYVQGDHRNSEVQLSYVHVLLYYYCVLSASVRHVMLLIRVYQHGGRRFNEPELWLWGNCASVLERPASRCACMVRRQLFFVWYKVYNTSASYRRSLAKKSTKIVCGKEGLRQT